MEAIFEFVSAALFFSTTVIWIVISAVLYGIVLKQRRVNKYLHKVINKLERDNK